MTKEDLKLNLDLLGINPIKYSLNGTLKPDAIILYRNYSNWEVFYLDERGKRKSEGIFSSEHEACNRIYKLFKDAKEIEKKFGINS